MQWTVFLTKHRMLVVYELQITNPNQIQNIVGKKVSVTNVIKEETAGKIFYSNGEAATTPSSTILVRIQI